MIKFTPFLESLYNESNADIIDTVKQGFYACFESFNPKLDEQTKRNSAKYSGRNVDWYGDKNTMIVIHKDDIDGMWGNIYDNSKMTGLTEMIRNSDDNIELECSYGVGTLTEFIDIQEEQEAVQNGDFDAIYEGKSEASSIGDDELDKYIGSEYLDDLDGDDLSAYKPFRFSLVFAKDEHEYKTYLSKIHETLGDDIDEEELEEFVRLETELRTAIKNNDGDLNNFRVQLRDGHHRVFASIDAGEEYVCVNLSKDTIGLMDKVTTAKRVTS